jgi:hypothetical protein
MVEVHIILELHQAALVMEHQAAIRFLIILHLLVVVLAVVVMIILATTLALVVLVDQVVVVAVDHYIRNLVVQVTHL